MTRTAEFVTPADSPGLLLADPRIDAVSERPASSEDDEDKHLQDGRQSNRPDSDGSALDNQTTSAERQDLVVSGNQSTGNRTADEQVLTEQASGTTGEQPDAIRQSRDSDSSARGSADFIQVPDTMRQISPVPMSPEISPRTTEPNIRSWRGGLGLRVLEEKTFFTLLIGGMLGLTRLILASPVRTLEDVLYGNGVWFTTITIIVASTSQTIRSLFERHCGRIITYLMYLLNKLEALLSGISTFFLNRWHQFRCSRAADMVLGVLQSCIRWLLPPLRRLFGLLVRYRYHIMANILLVVTITYFVVASLKGPLAPSTEAPSVEPVNTDVFRHSVQDQDQSRKELSRWFRLLDNSPLAGPQELSTLFVFAWVWALIAIVQYFYGALRAWASRNPSSGTIHDSIVHAVSDLENVQRKLVAGEKRLATIFNKATRYICKHWCVMTILILIGLGIADHALQLRLIEILVSSAGQMVQTVCGQKTWYSESALAFSRLIVLVIFNRPIVDLLRAPLVVVWHWPWKVIVRVLTVLMFATVWLAGTICLGIYWSTRLAGPVPVLDMLIKYADGQQGTRVTVAN